jgi:ribonuclease HI/exonuclease III
MELMAVQLTIWQQNVNKSPSCQHDLISSNHLANKGISIIALQEPAINSLTNLTIATKDWLPLYPTTHGKTTNRTRAITLIRANLSTDSWTQIDFQSSDVTIVQLEGEWGKLSIFNIYLEGNSNETLKQLGTFYSRNRNLFEHADRGVAHVLWLGDFNRHHPYWDDPNDVHLFTDEATKAAEELIDLIADVGLDLALPTGIPTHRHNVTKKWSRLDQVFLTDHSSELLISCDTQVDQRGIKTDHLPILTELSLPMVTAPEESYANFREVDWESFHQVLEGQLSILPPAQAIETQSQLDLSCEQLTEAIQKTIQEQVPVTVITPKSKRWWTKELSQLRKNANKLGRKAHGLRSEEAHTIHAEYAKAAKRYDSILKSTKKQHWRDWLEKAEDPDIWTIQRLINAPATDGGKARIPSLKYNVGDDTKTASTNAEKGDALAKGFFPPKPAASEIQEGFTYPKALKGGKITTEQIRHQLKRLKPYKAPGPDGIPNIVLSKNADILADRLRLIYVAMLDKNLQYKPWKSFTTIVLRKPGKPRYDLPKAYRPIALLNTMWKVLTAIIANQLTYLTEKHQLLPEHHFGGRPGRTTTDAMHLLTLKIKSAWRAGEVISALFLDIEGAFPNAVPEKLVHNLKKRKVPNKIVNFVNSMLRDRVTTLKFDGHSSDPIPLDNGIGQGDPLSMALYQYYNADLLEIPESKDEDAMAYVDDTLLLASGKNFEETHRKLADMMDRKGGVAEWSTDHNSPLEYSKLALIDFAHRQSAKRRPALQLAQIVVKPVASAKYLGVIFDQNLSWKAQQAKAVEKGTKWAAQIRRISKQTWGVTPKYARRLFISVAIPRIYYAIDLWYTPVQSEHPGPRSQGTAGVARQLATLQRAGATAITGGLRTSPTDALDACAFLLPATLNADKWCHRSLTRLATLPQEHPLYKTVKSKATLNTFRHSTPIHHLLRQYDINPRHIEKIPTAPRDPIHIGITPFVISIPESREDSTEEAEAAEEEVQIFTDGSATEGKVGAAAILLRAGKPARILHLCLGTEDEHTVHEAESIGILLGLHLVSTERRGNTSFAMGSDNQAAIRAFLSEFRKPGHHIARESLRLAQQLKQRKINKYTLTLRWTAGHEGIAGNEAADQEAKKAAGGLSSDKKLLPAYLRKPLLINPSAIRTARSKFLKSKWKSVWQKSERGRKILKYDDSTPSSKFLKSISDAEITRRAASSLSQLRLTHIPLNGYLKRFKRVDSSRCPACGADYEDIEHFLLACPSYAHERWALARKVADKGKSLTLKTLLGEPSLAKTLAKFMHATHRFRNSGEKP